jgi:hypothetical protein
MRADLALEVRLQERELEQEDSWEPAFLVLLVCERPSRLGGRGHSDLLLEEAKLQGVEAEVVLEATRYQCLMMPRGLITLTGGLQSGEYSPPAPCLDLTAISSAISLFALVISCTRWADKGGCVQLKLPALIPKFSYLCQQDANFARKGFAKIVEVSGVAHP